MSKLKTLLQEQVFKQAKAGESGSSDAVIDAATEANPEAVNDAIQELARGMMKRILSQLAARKPQEIDSEPNMFADYPGVHQFIGVLVERDGETAWEWRPIDNVTVGQLGAWMADDHRTETTRRQREPGMAKLFRDVSATAKGRKDLTVAETLKLRRAQGGQ